MTNSMDQHREKTPLHYIHRETHLYLETCSNLNCKCGDKTGGQSKKTDIKRALENVY